MKRFAAAMLAGIFSLPLCAGAQSSTPPPPGVVRATLPNGLRVVLLPNHLAPVTTTVLTYGVGSDDDTMPGIAHATEHMMFRGTADVSAGQFAIASARAGAQYDATTSDLATTYWFKIPSGYTGLALRLEADRMTGALEREADWKSERGAIEQEVRAHQSVPGAEIFGKIRHAFFGDTPYAQDGVGTIASFDAMHASDIAAFYHAWYHPNNATLVVAGDIDPAATLDEIRSDFGAIASVPLPAHKQYTIPPLTASTVSDSISQIPVPSAAALYRFPTLGSPDYAASAVLANVLSSGRGSLADLQAQGKILGGIAVAVSNREIGLLTVGAVGLPGATTASIQTQIDGVLDAYRVHGVPADLVDAAKLSMLSERDYRQASISGLAFAWANSLSLMDATPDTLYGDVQNVTVADVDRVLRTYVVPANSVSVLISPKPGAGASAQADGGSTQENVQYKPERDEPLPVWAAAYFRAPLRVPKSDASVATYRLHNGLTITVRPEHLSPTVVLQGSILTNPQLDEPRGEDGVSQITENLLPWGTHTYGRVAYQAQADAIAANIGLGSSFSVDVQSKNFDRAVQLLADGMLHPAFPAAALATLKNSTAGTLAAMENEPSTQAALAEVNALYPPGDPRRRRATAATVGAITLNDVKHWYAYAYRPDLTTIAIVGDVTPQHAREIVQHYFGAWRIPAGGSPALSFPPLKRNTARSVTVRSASNAHSEVTLTQVIGVHSGSPDAIPLELANTMLSGEGLGSMLFADLRTQRGYVYDVDSSIDIGRSSSTFSIDYAADNKNVGPAQAAAVSDIRHLQQQLVPADELQRAKALLLAQRVLPLDSYSGIAGDILGNALIGWGPKDDDAYWTRLLNTTPQQIRAAMQRWIHVDRFSRVIVAPEGS